MTTQHQRRFPEMAKVVPPRPTIRTEAVALRIACEIIEEVNDDDFYWTKEEISDRVFDVQQEIMRAGRPATVFRRLYRKQHPINCKGDRAGHPYGWEGIDEHCRIVADGIAETQLEAAIARYDERYTDDRASKGG